MAFLPVIPATLNVTLTQALAQAFNSSVVNSPAGAAVNLSAFSSISAKAVPITPGPTAAAVAFGTVVGSSTGILTLTTSVTDLASVPTGAAKLIIEGVNVAGDPAQILATGALQVNPST